MILPALKEKLGDCKFVDTSLCENKSAYHHTTETQFHIYDADDKQPVKIVLDGNYQLTVSNISESEICIVKTDKCLFKDNIQKCDCILFNGRKFYFVEIKSSSSGTRKDKRRKAAEQLAASIETLHENGISIANFDANAIICFKSGNTHPIQASRNTQRAIFFEKYKVSLEEGNAIEF